MRQCYGSYISSENDSGVELQSGFILLKDLFLSLRANFTFGLKVEKDYTGLGDTKTITALVLSLINKNDLQYGRCVFSRGRPLDGNNYFEEIAILVTNSVNNK